MRFRYVVKRSDDAALKDAEKISNRVGMEIAAKAHILVSRMIDGSVICELPPDLWIDRAFIGHEH